MVRKSNQKTYSLRLKLTYELFLQDVQKFKTWKELIRIIKINLLIFIVNELKYFSNLAKWNRNT